MITRYDVTTSQYENNAALAKGTKGSKCIFAGRLWELPAVEPDQVEALMMISHGLSPWETMGTIEVYENGAMNIFLRKDFVVFGYALYRRDNEESNPSNA